MGVHDTPARKARYRELIRKILADKAKDDRQRDILPHVDIIVAELSEKYLLYAESYDTKHGVATSQVAIINLAISG